MEVAQYSAFNSARRIAQVQRPQKRYLELSHHSLLESPFEVGQFVEPDAGNSLHVGNALISQPGNPRHGNFVAGSSILEAQRHDDGQRAWRIRVLTRQDTTGRTFPAIPRSTINTSPILGCRVIQFAPDFVTAFLIHQIVCRVQGKWDPPSPRHLAHKHPYRFLKRSTDGGTHLPRLLKQRRFDTTAKKHSHATTVPERPRLSTRNPHPAANAKGT